MQHSHPTRDTHHIQDTHQPQTRTPPHTPVPPPALSSPVPRRRHSYPAQDRVRSSLVRVKLARTLRVRGQVRSSPAIPLQAPVHSSRPSNPTPCIMRIRISHIYLGLHLPRTNFRLGSASRLKRIASHRLPPPTPSPPTLTPTPLRSR
ncbi:hypothetical protein BDV98DRAFT_569465 [Pterulicium gracile]|uniref:Uncharacterized protein n=1 Tax=Pterulicium gracile TaxID=1884261 RepID=A0A5C3QPG9_9AGAR|nr:hypothetical protein BDV98DRAFT_569465 [Pterula gracilis]